MEPPKRRPLETSGIPRLSKLPVPRGAPSALARSSLSTAYNRGLTQPSAQGGSRHRHGSTREGQRSSPEHGETEQAVVAQVTRAGDEDEASRLQSSRRRPRPSLSDRTAETLAQMPPTPSPRKRRSSFFQTESPMISPVRPSSSMARARPSTSMGIHPPLPDRLASLRPSSPEKRPLVPGAGNRTPQTTPRKASIGSHVPRTLSHVRTHASDAVEVTPSKMKPPSAKLRSNNDPGAMGQVGAMKSRIGAKTLGAKPTKPRLSVHGAFEVPSNTHSDHRTNTGRIHSNQVPAKMSSVSPRTTSNARVTPSRPLKTPSETVSTSSPKTTPQKSSASLREAIAKAKAERQAAIKARGKSDSQGRRAEGTSEDTDLASSNKGLLRKRIQVARTDGRLNIAAMGLSDIPPEVLNMYDASALESNGGAWYESVDLVRLIAADNEIERLGVNVFPDIDASALDRSDEDSSGNMFGGLETLDLHGNHISALPMGIRRLTNLTILNLSKNKLDNQSLAIISQVQCLRELRLTENAFEGVLDPSITELQHLEVLDLSNNSICALPDSLSMLSTLHTLLLAGNKITSLPSTLLSSAALVVLDVSQNRLTGNLASSDVLLPLLKSLDVSHNALGSIVDGSASMPHLQTLNAAENRLEALPDLSGSTSLITLTAPGNRITTVHESLVGLQHLKNVDLSRNDLKKIDERFGLLESLTVLHVANNPLRDRKYLTLNTEDLKTELRARTLLASNEAGGDHASPFTDSTSIRQTSTASQSWPVKPGGILDRSSTSATALDACDLEPLIKVNDIKSLSLQRNSLTQIPLSLTLLSSTLNHLDISNNKLSSLTYLAGEVSLPNLKSLDMSHNTISTFTPLIECLNAPKLNELSVSRNRLTTLPRLRNALPSLRTVLAADNRIAELTVESVQGLEMLDVSGNEIEHLEPKLGLLGGDGLRTLLVGANRFRVPRRDIVEKGTDAILTWLRGRIPEG